jgi:hypothetical protein
MDNFKFFQKDNNPTTTQLRKYHKRLLSGYTYRFNLYPGQTNYNAGGLISDRTIEFINQGQLTTYREIRSYYSLNYAYLSGGEDIITDEVHQELIRSVERPEAIHIGEIMGEMINSIQVLNEQVRNNT